MKKNLLLSVVMFFIAFCASAQRTATLFQKTYKITSTDSTTSLSVASIARASDGGYALLGNRSTANSSDMCVIRTDSLGSVIWSVNLNTDTTEAAENIRSTPDGGFVVSGWNDLPITGLGEMLLAKIDANGNIKWSTQFGGAEIDEAKDVAVLNSGDIMVVGRSYAGFVAQGYSILTRANGTPENGQVLRFGRVDCPLTSVERTTDGGAVAAGYPGNLFQRPGFDAGLIKFNAQGNVVWGRRYAANGQQLKPIARQTCDGGYIITGRYSISQPSGDIVGCFAIKTNAVGDTVWCKYYAPNRDIQRRLDTLSYASSLVEVNDGYIISGHMSPNGISDTVRYKTAQGVDTFYLQDRNYPFAMKIDQSGAFKWAKYYGDTVGISRFQSSVVSVDGGLTFAGETYSFGSANRRGAGYLVHTDKDGNIGGGTGSCKVRNLTFSAFNFTITDSTNIVVVDGGDELASNLRRESMTVVKSDICSATGLRTDVAACLKIDVADYHLPENAVKIYPNPVSNQLFVEIEKSVLARNEATEEPNSTSNLKIFDATGRLIQAQQTINDAVSINVSTFAKGIYMLKVERGGKYLVKKFIVE